MSASRPAAALLRSASRLSSRSVTRSQAQIHPTWSPFSRPAIFRLAHTIPKPPRQPPVSAPQTNPNNSTSEQPSEVKARKLVEPHYQLTFTCVPCSERSTHVVSKQGYHRGSVLITCPSCRNRHVISDHLNIFGDRKMTVEDLMREKGQLVKRGTLGEDGDVEFWQDDTADAAPAP
ncbi:DNL zinc finger-domain-containing protein [Microdochium trichocladiopsis]|uniref:DNL zinc finger-domain-containing protein n=1 Tax=Microdochium trichocladiopsis TaxID=1682393 RepID=A0A9P8Y3M6_9PEZI|nr:DNL zinc finger-domain-containing protein [Microdochium trichocladiopsis]KAH7027312.1 DNL zinc finger-domain-containing protein [Microdochium trichocladiopsis]